MMPEFNLEELQRKELFRLDSSLEWINNLTVHSGRQLVKNGCLHTTRKPVAKGLTK
jgi:hypothetical protein